MAGDPSASLPKQNKKWKQTKGAYRLFDHEQTTFESMSRPHWHNTREICDECVVTLLIQDTTWLDYSAHAQTSGLGWFGRSKEHACGGSGLFLHSVLAVEPRGEGQGRVIGLAHTMLWARTGEPIGRRGARRNRQRTSDDRESLRWAAAMREIGAAAPAARRLHVGDRESDLFDLYRAAQELAGVGFLIRVKHDRNASAGHDTPERQSIAARKATSLKRLLRAMPAVGQSKLWITPRADRAGRWATLDVCGGPVTLWPPQVQGAAGRAVRCWALRVWEVDAPDGAAPIEWMLLSSEPVNDLADALRLTEYYTLRWLIEQYHQCLKSGCKVQQRQLETVDRLTPLIGMLAVVAVRLLQLKNDARLTPQKPAIDAAPVELVQTLAKLIEVDAATLTVVRFTHEVAKLGGFLGRRGDGDPGWKTLWLGWHELTLLHAGYQLALAEGRCG